MILFSAFRYNPSAVASLSKPRNILSCATRSGVGKKGYFGVP